MDSLQASPAAPALLKAFQQFQPACTHFSLNFISPTNTVSHLGPIPQEKIPSRGCCSCLVVLCHQMAPSLQELWALNLRGVNLYFQATKHALLGHGLVRAEHHLHEKPAGDVGTVLKESRGLCVSELGEHPCRTKPALVRAGNNKRKIPQKPITASAITAVNRHTAPGRLPPPSCTPASPEGTGQGRGPAASRP